jgi:hypothetical protein
MFDTFEQAARVLDHCNVHLHLDFDGAAIDVVGIRAAVGGGLRKLALLTLPFVLIDDLLEAFAFLRELTAETVERRS